MKHLNKFESFDAFSDPMEKITLREYGSALVDNYQPFTKEELQRLTDFCNKMGFEIQARPKEVKTEVRKGRFDRFKDYVTSKFGGKKEEDPKGPEEDKQFIFLIPNDMQALDRFRQENLHRLREYGRARPDNWRLSTGFGGDYTMMKCFKTIDEFVYMEFVMSEHGEPVVRDNYRFDEMRTFFKFVEDLVR